MKLKTWIQKTFQKNKKDMITEEQLISYQQNFGGQKFQWIKTDRPELKGKVVKVRDIQPLNNGECMAIFDDGSKVNVRDINNKLMMIHGDMPPMSIDEVNAIYATKPPVVIPETTLPNGEVIAETKLSTASNVPPANFDTKTGLPISQVSEPAKPAEPAVNPFAMFNSDETEITIKVKVEMPDKKLLKMMYNNAEDKDVFIDQLSKYVTSMINNSVVSESVAKMLDPKATAPKKEETPEVNLTEVDEKQ